ncbi:gephyrin-like molybdotransferase Glp [Leucobacter sp. NPDC058333]|uniref:molybdopterin molybdotransferase MoeA n=1 Tax=Leucobacter sp. NPDC058333 TaxID=3346450 RepID=UPI003646E46B
MSEIHDESRSVAAHLATVLAETKPLPASSMPLRAAVGLTLASDVLARVDLPLWHNSAMDGYAVRASDTSSAGDASPVGLRVIGEVAAGDSADPALPPGTTVRIMTGAPMPSAADAVVPVEHTVNDVSGDAWAEHTVDVLSPVAAGAHVRRRGEDVTAGACIARAGDQLGARRIAALAAAGVAEVSVRPRPRVAVIATGAELRAAGEPLERGQIPESNSLLVQALLAEDGIEAVSVSVTDDDAVTLGARLRELAGEVDAVITTGGVGPGAHDVVRIALEREPSVHAVRVAVKPGQPQCFGRLAGGSGSGGGALMFALPGNPVSAAVSYELFVRPALLRLQGATRLQRTRVRAVVERGWRGSPGRLQVLPVRVRGASTGLQCSPAVDPRGYSHAVGGQGGADGYALVDVDRGDVAEGESVDVILVTS